MKSTKDTIIFFLVISFLATNCTGRNNPTELPRKNAYLEISPGENIQAIVDANPPGTRFLINSN